MTTPGPISPDNLLLFSHEGVTFDHKEGAGAVSDVENVAYSGFVVMMRPTVFLALCPPLPPDTAVSGKFDGSPLGMGFLVVRESRDGIWIRGHEGRHRMAYLLDRCGDVPMPVAVFPADGSRARHVTRGFVERFVAGAVRERTSGTAPGDTVRGPLFDRIIIQGKDIAIGRKYSRTHAFQGRDGSLRWSGRSVTMEDGLRFRLEASVDPYSVERDEDGSVSRASVMLTGTYDPDIRKLHPHGDAEVIKAISAVLSEAGADTDVSWSSRGTQAPGEAVFHVAPSVVDVLWPELQPAASLAPGM